MKEQLQSIKGNIREAATRRGRSPEEITLIAVSKTYPVAAIKEAISLGCKDFGENKVQELIQKIEQVEEPIQWHLIGHLQTNKVKYVVGKVALIHSVDSLKLLEEIQKQSLKKEVVTRILLEVNVAQEESKSGIKLEETMNYIQFISRLTHVRCEGLMTVAPYVDDPEDNRPVFKQLYDLSVDIQKQKFDNINMRILSMGMSNDYKVAIEEGATMVRIGTALFGARNYT